MPGRREREEKSMVKHMILWQLSEALTDAQKREVAAAAKQHLEGLKGQIEGLLDIAVVTDRLASSTADLMLDSTFTSEETLRKYAVHPCHVAVADTYVRQYIRTRCCMDFEIPD